MSRIQSVDVFRLLAILAVISIHTLPFGADVAGGIYAYLHVAINQGARFAVPFFFIISGYFYAKRIDDGVDIWPVTTKTLKRLGLIWLFFSAIYIVPFEFFSTFEGGFPGLAKAVYSNLRNVADHPVQLIFEGSRVHLWFLSSLACSVIITALFLKYWKPNPLFPLFALSVALYVFGLLGKAYSVTPLGIDVGFNTRDGPFFGTVYFVSGYLLKYIKISPNYLFYGFVLMILGYAIHFGEIFYLHAAYHVSPADHDYVAGTLLVGLGVSLMALSRHRWLNIESASTIGKYTLGIYGIHLAFVDLFRHANQQISNHAWDIAFIFVVFLLSAIAILVLTKDHRLKKILT